MIIKPRIRGFICTTAHPKGCAAHVDEQIAAVKARGTFANGPKRVLVIGASGGYGLASRIVNAFGAGAATLGVSFEKAPEGDRTATAGWYNNRAFEARARAAGLYAETLDGDAFSDQMKTQVIERIKSDLGQIDLLVYSLASPVRQHPRTGVLYRSAIKPIGETYHVKTLNVDRGVVTEVDLEPATQDEIAATVAVMGGEDWEFWIDALQKAGVLANGFKTLSYTYIGTDLTWPIYWHATLGKAKEDLDRAARAITQRLATLNGEGRVAVLKFVVSQASSAIPVVPLYGSLLYRVMKDAGVHETTIEQIDRLYRTQVYSGKPQRLDDAQRIRMDDVELTDAIQGDVKRRWPIVSTENLPQLGDLDGFRADFLRIFGFGLDGVDYEEDLDPALAEL
jgi:enoyl-[acyl-carrier protein] reductase / trans-2-enoyl-CoA reductase (NAD+)